MVCNLYEIFIGELTLKNSVLGKNIKTIAMDHKLAVDPKKHDFGAFCVITQNSSAYYTITLHQATGDPLLGPGH